MPHIHKLYDFVVSIFIVHKNKTLLVYHKKYNEWVPIGGHVDLNEDPEEALHKEIWEESHLKVRLFSQAPKISHPGVKSLPAPDFMDVHRITDTHKHIALIYFGTSTSSKAVLHQREHRELRWLDKRELKDPKLNLSKSIFFYSLKALEKSKQHS